MSLMGIQLKEGREEGKQGGIIESKRMRTMY